MSGRDRVGARAQLIYEHLRTRPGQALRKPDLLAALDLNDSATTRRAIQRARELAEADGLYLTVPVYDNGYTMAVTDDPSAAVDPAMWLARTEHGVGVPRHIADDFMKSRMGKLSASERAYVHLQDQVNELVAATQQSAQALAKALMDERRESRNAGR